MIADLHIALAVLAVMLALFVTNRLRLDLVALLGLLALVLSGVLSTEEALAGFSDPVVLMIAGLFVVGAGLFRTGVADAMGRQVERLAGQGVHRLTLVIMLVTAFLSAFLSSTGTVAVMLPVVLAIARRRRISPSRLLMPLAFAALLGGMLTLIGTPPNLIVSTQLAQAGLEPFGFFSFTLPGLVMLALGTASMMLLAPVLVPERRGHDEDDNEPSWSELFGEYGLSDRIACLDVPAGSPLVAANVTSSELRSAHGVTVMVIVSQTERGRFVHRAAPDTVIHAGDSLYVIGKEDDVAAVAAKFGLKRVAGRVELPRPVSVVDALVPPRSEFIGQSLRQLRLRSGLGATVLAQRVAGQPGEPVDLDRPLGPGDALLLTGGSRSLQRLSRGRSRLVLLADTEREQDLDWRKAPLAIAILLAMMLTMTFGWVANVTAVMIAAVALVLFRCVSMDQAYRSINFESVILIAAILPMATALDKTGGLGMAADALMDLTGAAGPLLLMAALFIFTAGLSQIVSNTATTVLVAPIAIHAAMGLGVNPHAVLMTVAIAASSAFATPVASPVNTLVLSAGGYRFTDFARVGIPLQLVLLLATLLVVPVLFPL
ncbi:MAG: SLC13 family permease [Wenzhouxiangella sp.]|nr:MAG: SLC13 family permease [Wenzhouxiangella sp.]